MRVETARQEDPRPPAILRLRSCDLHAIAVQDRVFVEGDERYRPRCREVAPRCLACANCTMVCATCFCHDVVDGVSLSGELATRSRDRASCFSAEFSWAAGAVVRESRAPRYRQWLAHKFASWIDQSRVSGCVGCGRCITWCPVGIDVAAIRATSGAVEMSTA